MNGLLLRAAMYIHQVLPIYAHNDVDMMYYFPHTKNTWAPIKGCIFLQDFLLSSPFRKFILISFPVLRELSKEGDGLNT